MSQYWLWDNITYHNIIIIYTTDLNLVIILHAAVIAPNSARPSTSTMLDMIFVSLAIEYLQHVSAAWWHHQMETFSTSLALCAGNSMVTSEFPSQRPLKRSFVVIFDLLLNKWLCKQLRRQWFETPLSSLWCHCNEILWIFWHFKHWQKVVIISIP